MPIKIGKSKSSSGSELVHANPCADDSNNHQKKSRGLKRLFERSKNSYPKAPTPRSSTNDDSPNSGKFVENINNNSFRIDSSPAGVTCHSVSPKLYTNSCASSIEELSSVVSNTNLISSAVSSATIPCSPIQDVILEEEYEEALLLNNRTQVINQTESENTGEVNSQFGLSNKINQGIYNEPNDTIQGSNKEIIETCRLSQITPTNQFKEIRSRSGSDTDPLIVHPDISIGSRCSTNSSSVGSALTLSESPAVARSSCSPPQNSADNYQNPPSLPAVIPPSSVALSINVHTNHQSSSGPPTVYMNSPKGNAFIVHHPSSPFAPPTSSKQASSSNPSTCVPSVANASPASDRLSSSPKTLIDKSELIKTHTPTSNIVSRRPGRFSKTVDNELSQITSSKQNSDISAQFRGSERRSEYYSKHPVYEEAWDVKFQKIGIDFPEKCRRSAQSGLEKTDNNINVNSCGSSTTSAGLMSYNRPQSAAGARRRTDSPNSKYPSPPAVPPHRRSSAHYKISHGASLDDSKVSTDPNTKYQQSSQSLTDSRQMIPLGDDNQNCVIPPKPNMKHSINPSFEDQGLNSEYDYAYNDTWSLGVQLNMTLNLTSEVAPVAVKDVYPTPSSMVSGYMDKIDSVDSEESSSLSTSQDANCKKEKETTTTDEILQTNIAASVDNDSLSNDSYEEPWDVRHGRVISELTSTRLIDPACVLSAHEQPATTLSGPCSAPPPPAHQASVHYHRNRRTVEPKGYNSNASSGFNSKRQRSVSGSRRSTIPNTNSSGSLINKCVALEDQPWYHDDCTRSQAEQLLSGAKEGSFLVRKSETCKNDFSLTIKHNNDFLHMKICKNQRGFILGQYSQPYASIPHMLHHYSLTMVPVKGADAVLLTNPIARC